MRRDDFPQVKALRTGQVVRHAVFGLPHERTGELRWLRVTAFPDAWEEQGRPRRAYAIFGDVTEQRRAEARLREGNRLLGHLHDANVVGVVVGTEEKVQEANDAFLDIIGYSHEDLESGRITWDVITPAEWAASDADALEQLRMTGVCRPYEKEHLHRDGRRVPVLIGAAVLDRDPLRGVEFVADLTDRQCREQERADLLAREQAARKEADSARERLAFLLQAGDLAGSTASEADLLEQINKLVEVAVTSARIASPPAPTCPTPGRRTRRFVPSTPSLRNASASARPIWFARNRIAAHWKLSCSRPSGCRPSDS